MSTSEKPQAMADKTPNASNKDPKAPKGPKEYGFCSEKNPWLGRSIFAFALGLFFWANFLQVTVIYLPLFKEAMFLPLAIPIVFINQTFYIMALWAYLKTAFSTLDRLPKKMGPPKLDQIPGFENDQVYNAICHKCPQTGGAQWKPPRMYHCSSCRTCVFKLDHHCVWVNNCVGAGNAKFFCQFLFYTTSFCVSYFISMVVLGGLRAYYCKTPFFFGHGITGQKNEAYMSKFVPHDDDPPYEDLLDIFMVIGITVYILFGAFFGYFAFDFLDDFCKGIKWNQTTYENYKKWIGARFPTKRHYKVYLGDTWWEWLMPFPHKSMHNFLELNYSVEDRNAKIFAYEQKYVMKHELYDEFFIDNYGFDVEKCKNYKLKGLDGKSSSQGISDNKKVSESSNGNAGKQKME